MPWRALAPEFARFVASLPEQYLISENGTSKAVFREAMRGIVPDEILNRRDKIGFEPPEHRWLSQMDKWVEAALTSEQARSIPVFHHSNLLNSWRRARGNPRRYGSWSWRCVNLIKWAEQVGVQFA